MINKENIEYIIQYNYDLNGETITIPVNCILKLECGTIDNGTIICNNTVIVTYNKNWITATLQEDYTFFGWGNE